MFSLLKNEPFIFTEEAGPPSIVHHVSLLIIYQDMLKEAKLQVLTGKKEKLPM